MKSVQPNEGKLRDGAEAENETMNCDDCGDEAADIIGCPDGAEICQACFDAGNH